MNRTSLMALAAMVAYPEATIVVYTTHPKEIIAMPRHTTSVKYATSEPGRPVEMLVETDTDLAEILVEINGLNLMCIDAQQAAQIVRQFTSWLGDRAAARR